MLWYFYGHFGISFGHLVSYMAIWNLFCGHLEFFRFGMLYQEKSGNPAHETKGETTEKWPKSIPVAACRGIYLGTYMWLP
jgi:hypothetical protein